jgi:RHS repeat-associated protein
MNRITMYYVHQDRLGSYDVITLPDGTIKEELSYDVWDNRKLYNTWLQYENIGTPHIFHRCYTQHEHLNKFGIINMNGRIYDPNTASFFSPDPFVADATSTQAFNRYSYCLNNPLMYTDPNGEFIHLIVGAVIGGFMNAMFNAGNISNFGDFAKYFSVGALAGGLSAGVGAGVSSAIAGGSFMGGALGTTAAMTSTGIIAGGIIGTATGFTNGFILGVGNTFVDNSKSNIGQSLRSGLHQGATQAACGFASGVIAGSMDYLFKAEDKIANKANKLADEWKSTSCDPNSIGNNFNNTSFMGPDNPILNNANRNYYYGNKITNWGYKEYPAYLHDIDYSLLGIGSTPNTSGAAALALSTRTLAADWSLAGRQIYLSLKHFDFGGIAWGMGMSGISLYKSFLYSPLSIIEKIKGGW